MRFHLMCQDGFAEEDDSAQGIPGRVAEMRPAAEDSEARPSSGIAGEGRLQAAAAQVLGSAYPPPVLISLCCQPRSLQVLLSL